MKVSNHEITVGRFIDLVDRTKLKEEGNLRIPSENLPLYSQILKTWKEDPTKAAALSSGIRVITKGEGLKKANVIMVADGALRSLVICDLKKHLSEDEFKVVAGKKIGVVEVFDLNSQEIADFVIKANAGRAIIGLQKVSIFSRLDPVIHLMRYDGTLQPIDPKTSDSSKRSRDSYLLSAFYSFFTDKKFHYKTHTKAKTYDNWGELLKDVTGKDFQAVLGFIKLCNSKLDSLKSNRAISVQAVDSDKNYELRISAGIMSCLTYSAGKAFNPGMSAAELFNSLEVQDTIRYLEGVFKALKGDVNSTCAVFATQKGDKR